MLLYALTDTLCGHHARHLGGWPHGAEGLGPWWLGSHGAWHILEVCRDESKLVLFSLEPQLIKESFSCARCHCVSMLPHELTLWSDTLCGPAGAGSQLGKLAGRVVCSSVLSL